MSQLIKTEIGFRISKIRKGLGLTMEEFGKRVNGASKSNVSKWERGDSIPNNKRLKIIADIGNVSIDYLLTGNKKKTKEYIHFIVEEILLKKGSIHQEFKSFGESDNRLGLYNLYLATEKAFSLELSPSMKKTFIDLITDNVYKSFLEIDSSDDQIIVSLLYSALETKISNRQKDNSSVNKEIFNYLNVAFDLAEGEIVDSRKLEYKSVSKDYLNEVQLFIDKLRELSKKQDQYLINKYNANK